MTVGSDATCNISPCGLLKLSVTIIKRLSCHLWIIPMLPLEILSWVGCPWEF